MRASTCVRTLENDKEMYVFFTDKPSRRDTTPGIFENIRADVVIKKKKNRVTQIYNTRV